MLVARVAVALVALIAGAVAGCGSNCATNCPTTEFDIYASNGDNLNVLTASWTGPGCPVGTTPLCRPDATGTNPCARFTIIGAQPGTCELDLTFNDGRVPFSAMTEFGAETHQGCCQGFPVLGASSVTVPPLHPIVEVDSGVDAGVDATVDTATDAPDSSDATSDGP